MKNSKKAWLSAFASLAVIAIISLSAFSLSNKHVYTSRAPITWYYNNPSATESDFKIAANWSQTNDPDDSECFTSGLRPCQVSVEADDTMELQSYLSSLGSTSVLSVSTGRKP